MSALFLKVKYDSFNVWLPSVKYLQTQLVFVFILCHRLSLSITIHFHYLCLLYCFRLRCERKTFAGIQRGSNQTVGLLARSAATTTAATRLILTAKYS